MSFELVWTDEGNSKFEELKADAEAAQRKRLETGKKKSSKQEGLFKQVLKAITLLKSNPAHSGLNTHQYSELINPYDSKQKVFEAYVQNNTPGAYRIFWCYGPKQRQLTIISITSHP
jgi:hypothetical protein